MSRREEVEELVEALLKASERVEKVLKEKLGERAQDIDLEIALDVEDVKKVDAFLEVKGLRAKYSYEEVVEEALNEGLRELEGRLAGKGNEAAGEDEG